VTLWSTPPPGGARRPAFTAIVAAAAALVVAIGAATVVGPATGAAPAAAAGSAAHGTYHRRTSSPGSYRSGPSAPDARAAREAGVVASARFRRTVGIAASSFVEDVDALRQAVTTGDVTTARADELAAQAQYDAVRYLTSPASPTSSPLDETPTEVPSGAHLTGLHLVERDLWVPGHGPTAAAVAQLAEAAPLLEDSLSRIQLSPGDIDLVAVRELGWVTSVAVPGLEEQYSHLDSVDVAATVGAAGAAFDAVAPLGRLVTAGRTTAAGARLAALTEAVQALGTPGTVPDAGIPESRWRSVAEDADAAAAVLGALAPALAGYGPRQIYGYNA
jgi:hypothetical protein